MNKKKIITIATVLALTCGSVIGVSAANGFLGNKSISKGVVNIDDKVVIDGGAVGSWFENVPVITNYTGGTDVTWSKGDTFTIDLTSIIAELDANGIQYDVDDIVEIYYTNDTVKTISYSGVEYQQSGTNIVATFQSNSPAGNTDPVEIKAIHIIKPDSFGNP